MRTRINILQNDNLAGTWGKEVFCRIPVGSQLHPESKKQLKYLDGDFALCAVRPGQKKQF
jgi:hypothetical protein